MSNLKSTKSYTEFCKECSFFCCKDPDFYGPGWTGKERYIITSELSEEQILVKYPEIMEQLSPYILLSTEYADVFQESRRNSDKYKKRQKRTFSLADIDEISDRAEIASARDMEAVEQKLLIEEALSLCTAKERQRIAKFYYEGVPLTHIEKGVTIPSITESIKSGLKKIQKKYI